MRISKSERGSGLGLIAILIALGIVAFLVIKNYEAILSVKPSVQIEQVPGMKVPQQIDTPAQGTQVIQQFQQQQKNIEEMQNRVLPSLAPTEGP